MLRVEAGLRPPLFSTPGGLRQAGDDPSGEFNHSSSIELLDSEGRIVNRTATLGQDDPAFLAAIQAL